MRLSAFEDHFGKNTCLKSLGGHTARMPARIGGAQAERAHKRTHPNTTARNHGAQPNTKPKGKHPHRIPKPGLAGYRRSVHTYRHTLTAEPGLAG